ncbi:hypothetical protein M9H77_14685 [Catharanthus roseus]|uniref:Uncharacterized protein n=1 Tax=Catharanthus roseus TaxID=4058 RepID=A0ACC0BP23_CATRO|nr:hypothetical protein M9H77_14685 [Catharanthus roseus]
MSAPSGNTPTSSIKKELWFGMLLKKIELNSGRGSDAGPSSSGSSSQEATYGADMEFTSFAARVHHHLRGVLSLSCLYTYMPTEFKITHMIGKFLDGGRPLELSIRRTVHQLHAEMVWFQCEDCGDNLKKPKLPNHFRMCSASKLSCIDCGQMFGRQDVEGHTQCITEAEKYGPKGQVKAMNASNAKPKNCSNQKPDVDISVGLSESAPWFCSLCNTKATSKQTLLLHADGKKHRAKARAFHAAKQQPKQTEGTINSTSTETSYKTENQEGKNIGEQNDQKASNVASKHESSVAENGNVQSGKKRKLEDAENDCARKKSELETTTECGNGEVIQVEKPETEEIKGQGKKTKKTKSKDDGPMDSSSKNDDKNNIKWKKLITSTLKSNPEGVLKLKKLKKLVLKSLKESGITEDKSLLTEMLEQKITSSSRFEVDGKAGCQALGALWSMAHLVLDAVCCPLV